MGFIETFLRKDAREVTKEDIEALISRRIEENSNLDYKDIRAYSNFNELSRDVSAFANSEGGLLILGVSEESVGKEKYLKIFPKEITWGNETFSKEKLEDNIIAKVQPRINGLRIQPVREGDGSQKVIFLIDVPKSDNAPHMASDNRYYRRLNFRRIPMEHYEIANLFKISWTIKEKLIEKIYEPLSSILEKHTKQLIEYSCPFGQEIEEILSRTYYKLQMPGELIEKIDNYVDGIKDLNRKAHYAHIAMTNIVNKNVLEYLGKEYHPSNNELRLDFKAISKRSRADLYQHEIYKLLLTNKKIQTYIKSVYYRDLYEKISVTYSNETYYINLDEFDEHIWKKCLKEASENTEIIQMTKSADTLWEEAWDLIDNITTY